MAGVMYTNAIYFPSSSMYQGVTPGMMNYGCVNHVYYAFAGVSPDGSVFVSVVLINVASWLDLAGPVVLTSISQCQLSDEWADARAPVDGSSGGLGSLLQLKQQHPHLRVLLSIGGGTTSSIYPSVASDATLRTNFARSVLGLVEASGLDGIDSESSPGTRSRST
jgi:chitinase